MEKLIITADDISISGNVMTYTRDGVVYQWNGIPTRRPCTDNMAKQFALILSIEGLESSDPVRRIRKAAGGRTRKGRTCLAARGR